MTSELQTTDSSKQLVAQSSLTAWERVGSCKKHRVICRQSWEQIPDHESDPCLAMIEKTGPNSILMLPESAHFVYQLCEKHLEDPTSDFVFEYDTGDGLTIVDLPDCH